MTSSATGRFFYPSEWEADGRHVAPCDANLVHARESVRCVIAMLFPGQDVDADNLVRLLDRLMEAHVAHALNRIVTHHHD